MNLPPTAALQDRPPAIRLLEAKLTGDPSGAVMDGRGDALLHGPPEPIFRDGHHDAPDRRSIPPQDGTPDANRTNGTFALGDSITLGAHVLQVCHQRCRIRDGLVCHRRQAVGQYTLDLRAGKKGQHEVLRRQRPAARARRQAARPGRRLAGRADRGCLRRGAALAAAPDVRRVRAAGTAGDRARKPPLLDGSGPRPGRGSRTHGEDLNRERAALATGAAALILTATTNLRDGHVMSDGYDERMRRWRLVLGEAGVAGPELGGGDARIDAALGACTTPTETTDRTEQSRPQRQAGFGGSRPRGRPTRSATSARSSRSKRGPGHAEGTRIEALKPDPAAARAGDA